MSKSGGASDAINSLNKHNDLAALRAARFGGAPPEERLHDEWAAESVPMSDIDKLEMRDSAFPALEGIWDGSANDDDALLEQWEHMSRNFVNMGLGNPNAHADYENQQYMFEKNNPFLSQAGCYEQGIALYSAGKLHQAALAFQAAIQRKSANASHCWRMLGTCYAENDDDVSAIVPLIQSIRADPDNLEALLDLSVSFTNELDESQALHYMREWLVRHPDYKEIPAQVEADMPGLGNEFVENDQMRTLEMFHRAAKLVPKDSDVWAVIGVLCNLSRDFSQAEKAFSTAVELDPSSYSLWNKLGATRANGNISKFQDAIEAYRRALELKPNYVRSWSNMGIAYSNQSVYSTATTYYLKALSLNPGAEHIWQYLRFALACMNRQDLVELAQQQDVELFRKEFKF